MVKLTEGVQEMKVSNIGVLILWEESFLGGSGSAEIKRLFEGVEKKKSIQGWKLDIFVGM